MTGKLLTSATTGTAQTPFNSSTVRGQRLPSGTGSIPAQLADRPKHPQPAQAGECRPN